MMAAHRAEFTAHDVYQAERRGVVKLGKLGALKTASKEILRAQMTGTQADKTKVGAAGDVLIGGKNIADFLNLLCCPAK